MTVKLYNNNSDKKVVNKDLTLVETKDCILYDATNILNPVLKFKNMPSGNYVYIPYLDRYYYITDITLSNQACFVTCAIDVLYTYKNNIYNTVQYIERCENLRDTMLIDDRINMSVDSKIYTTSFGESIITNHFTYILGVI